MSLRERLHTDMTAAMRSGDVARRDALRMMLAAVQRAEKDARRDFSDEEVLAVLARERRVRAESAEAFRGGGRDDLAGHEEEAIAVISEYLPTPLGEAEIGALVDQAIAETGAAGPRDMGRVMGWISPRTRGRADGKQVSTLVAKALAERAVGGGG